jgi:anaerobic magnesium-protoporphyrin IX monomethyl ester cyclase
MKILLANPAYRIDLGRGLEQYFFCAGSRCPWSLVKRRNEYPRYAMFPFMMGYAAAILEKEYHQVEVIDAIPLNLTEQDFIEKVRQVAPGLIVFEPVTTAIDYIARLAKVLKESTGAKIIFTGSHVTALPGESLKEYPAIDFILQGEYEFSLVKLAGLLPTGADLSEIEGIAFYRDDGRQVIREKAIIRDLNSLPIPARHLFPSGINHDPGLYHDGFCQNRPAIQMHSSRGCPFRCGFCLWTQVIYTQGVYRMFSPERVVEEMQLLKEDFGAKEIYDDTFTGNKKHVLDICRLISARKLKLPWSAMADAMICDEEMVYAMKTAGCIGLKFGLESANKKILQQIKKPLDTGKLSRLVKLCNRLKIKTHVSVSFGHVNETDTTVKETMDFVLKLSCDSIQFSIATPYPGTRFYEEVKASGYISEMRWKDYDPTHNTILDLPGISADELRKIEAAAHGRWLRKKISDPAWLLRQIRFLIYLLRKQGIRGFLLRCRRAIHLLFSKTFR